MAPAVATYAPRDPSQTVLYTVIAEHLETFLASCHDDPDGAGLPAYVQREFYDYLQCGILAHGFLRLGCDACHKELLLPFSCKRRGFCPSCAGRRIAQAIRSSGRYPLWGTLKRGSTPRWQQALTPWWMTNPSSPGPWRPRCSSASPVGNGPDRRSGASARDLVMRARRPRSQVPAVPASTGFPYTPTPRSPRTGAISWHA